MCYETAGALVGPCAHLGLGGRGGRPLDLSATAERNGGQLVREMRDPAVEARAGPPLRRRTLHRVPAVGRVVLRQPHQLLLPSLGVQQHGVAVDRVPPNAAIEQVKQRIKKVEDTNNKINAKSAAAAQQVAQPPPNPEVLRKVLEKLQKL